MKITLVNLYRYDIPLKAPIAISLGTIENARNILVEIQTDERITGWGEGSPFWMIVGETQASSLAAAHDMARLLIGRDPLDIEGCITALIRYLPGHPTTRSASTWRFMTCPPKPPDAALPVSGWCQTRAGHG